VRVTPNSSSDTVVLGPDRKLAVKITSPPVEGKANKALIKFIAKKLGVPQAAVSIQRGEHSREKSLLVRGVSLETAEKILVG
jgi:uncharacterized protein